MEQSELRRSRCGLTGSVRTAQHEPTRHLLHLRLQCRRRCSNPDSRYHGSPLKTWNTCASHEAPQPSTAALIARLGTCAAGLDHRALKAAGEYRDYYAERAQQCRSWAADLKEDHRIGNEDIVGGLREFEQIAL